MTTSDDELAMTVARLTGTSFSPGADLAVLSELCIEQLQRGVDATTGQALAAVVCDLQERLLRRTEARLADRARRIVGRERGLARLRTMTTAHELTQRICDEVSAACGLERVLLSRVEDGDWRPWMVNAAISSEPWYVEWANRVTPLSRMYLESALADQHRAALVTDTSGRRVHPIIWAGRSNSFVVAPIRPADRVIGFLHADHGRGGRTCDETDRDLLWAFAEGFAHFYERAVLLGRLVDGRNRVRETLGQVEKALDKLTEAEMELVLAPDETTDTRAASMAAGNREAFGRLTPRERDILEVVAQGATNQEIADLLVLTVGTVKTHVKHILGKLGAVNRSQAIAAYLVTDLPVPKS